MANKEVTVYSTPGCVQCMATKRWLDSKDISYTEGDTAADLEAIKSLLGFTKAPVVKVVDKNTQTLSFWYGHNPNELEAHLLESAKAEAA